MAPLYVSATRTLPSASASTPSGCCSSASSAGPSTCPKSNSPWPTAVCMTPSSIQRTALDSLSAIHSRRPSGEVDSPDGWAIQASSIGPSRSASTVVPAYMPAVRFTGSNHQSWWIPAIATMTRSSYQATSHGELRSTAFESCASKSTVPRHCRPVPATVVTSPEVRFSPRSRWLTVSATTTSYPAISATCGGSRHSPPGSLNWASLPSRCPRFPVPILVKIVSSSCTSTSEWCDASDTSNVPAASARALAGNLSGVSLFSGCTAGAPLRRSVPLASCFSTSSSISRRSPSACPSPAMDATTYPSGSMTFSVGQARAAYCRHISMSTSSRTGCSTPYRSTAAFNASGSFSCSNFGECTPMITSTSLYRSSSGRSSSLTFSPLMQQNVQ